MSRIDVLSIHQWWSVNIDSGNGLLPNGNKPLPKPILTKFYDTKQFVCSVDFIPCIVLNHGMLKIFCTSTSTLEIYSTINYGTIHMVT